MGDLNLCPFHNVHPDKCECLGVLLPHSFNGKVSKWNTRPIEEALIADTAEAMALVLSHEGRIEKLNEVIKAAENGQKTLFVECEKLRADLEQRTRELMQVKRERLDAWKTIDSFREAIREIERLHASRENVMGDPCSLLQAKAELAAAIDAARKA